MSIAQYKWLQKWFYMRKEKNMKHEPNLSLIEGRYLWLLMMQYVYDLRLKVMTSLYAKAPNFAHDCR